ncbi:hypothetical protein HK096_006083 [Nowakowskiella sp. JEL0078]|nr:hypothetical protein HK096_006083 [Nowakowskiella sp. JEL0078]
MAPYIVDLKFVALLLCMLQISSALNAIAVLSSINSSSVTGIISFSNSLEDPVVFIDISISGLNPNSHFGLHIHNWGDITDRNAGLLSGAHFNPTNKSHACPLISGFESTFDKVAQGISGGQHHVGDILPGGYIFSDNSGSAKLRIPGPYLSLDDLTINFIVGRTVVVHSTFDDCATQPTGNSGARLAQGVIGWGSQNPASSSEDDDVFRKSSEKTGLQAISQLSSVNSSSLTGTVQLYQESADTPIVLYIKVSGADANSVLSWHIHASGNISDVKEGLAALAHFNPLNTTHGCFKNNTRHAGDLDLLYSDSHGNIETTVSTELLSLYPGTAVYTLGRAIIVHAKKDDCTGNNGNAGSRLAQGVVGFRNATLKFDGKDMDKLDSLSKKFTGLTARPIGGPIIFQ